MSWTAKPSIDRLVPYEPGRPIDEVKRSLGIRRLDKLASNENPLGVSKKVQAAVRRFLPNMHFYPESSGPLLVEALAKKLGVSTREIILGNGSNEIIELLCRGLISDGDEVVSSACSFLVYPLITQVSSGCFKEAPMKDFRFDLRAIRRLITDKTRLVFIANPNNPTGTYVTKSELDAFIADVPSHVVVALDEAYLDFVDAKDFPNGLRYIKEGRDNVIVLRTFSKSYGLAGLRIGFGVAEKRLIEYLHKIRQPFNVNAVAQTAARAALLDKTYFRRTQQVTRTGRNYLCDSFRDMNLSFVPSEANFVLVDMGTEARPIVERLLRKGIIVRAMHAYGLHTHMRISVGTPEQNKRFIRTLKAILKK